jgi:hypothetical protein
VKGIQNYSDKGPGPFERGDNYKNAKIWWGHFKNLVNHSARKTQIYMKASLHSVDFKFLPIMVPGDQMGPQ